MVPRRAVRSLVVLLLTFAAAVACAGDPALEIERRRAAYSAEVSGFLVRDDPGSEQPTILLDLLIRGEAEPPLPSITLDLSMADATGREKAHRRLWVDAGPVGPGGEQRAVRLDGVDYAPGDGFWVEVRSPVPPAERGEYREFGGAGK